MLETRYVVGNNLKRRKKVLDFKLDGKYVREQFDVKSDKLIKLMYDWDAKQWAVFYHCNCNLDLVKDISELDIDDEEFYFEGEDLLVLTDSEADDRWEDELDSYIEDCLEIPDWIRPYFDDEAWKSDARYDGRGHAISRYDGVENDYCFDFDDGSRSWVYLYRM